MANKRNNESRKTGSKPGNNKRNNKRGNSTNRKFSRERTEDDRTGDDRAARGTNNPAWYTSIPTLAANTANLDFNWPAGTLTDLGSAYLDEFSIPGIITLEVVPTIGPSYSLEDPINRSASKVWQIIRGTKSASSVYEPCDVAILTMGIASIVSYIEWLKRLYGIATLYSDMNMYLPQALLEANYMDADDVRVHRSILRAGINEMVNAIATFNIPGTMPFFERIKFLYTNIYTEGTSIRDQLYMVVPAGFYQYYYDTDDEDYRGHLRFLSTTPGGTTTDGDEYFENQMCKTVDEVLKFGWVLIKSILNDGDMYQLSADINAAFADNQLLKHSYMPDNYTVTPIYDPAFLNQIHNAKYIPILGSSLGIRQDTASTSSGPVGIVMQRIQRSQGTPSCGEAAYNDYVNLQTVLDMPSNTVTVDDIMESTRFTTCSYYDDKGNAALSHGSEVITGIYVWHRCAPGQFGQTLMPTVEILDTSNTTKLVEFIERESLFKSFKWAPHRVIYTSSSSADVDNGVFYGNCDNYTLVPNARLRKLHNVALLSLFGLDLK